MWKVYYTTETDKTLAFFFLTTSDRGQIKKKLQIPQTVEQSSCMFIPILFPCEHTEKNIYIQLYLTFPHCSSITLARHVSVSQSPAHVFIIIWCNYNDYNE